MGIDIEAEVMRHYPHEEKEEWCAQHRDLMKQKRDWYRERLINEQRRLQQAALNPDEKAGG